MDVFPGVVRAAHQRTRFDVAETELHRLAHPGFDLADGSHFTGQADLTDQQRVRVDRFVEEARSDGGIRAS